MANYIRKFLLLSGLIIVFAIPFFSATSVSASDDPLINNAVNEACQGVTLGGSCPTTSGTQLSNIIKDVVNILSIIIGLAAVFVIILQGLRFITSGGDSNTVSSARNAILYAVIGLIIAITAQLIVHFVISTGTPPTTNTTNSTNTT